MMQPLTHQNIISALKMTRHPEGGFYSETYRCGESVNLDRRTRRSLGTSIYFLLSLGDISHFHRLASDEIWHFHQGDPVTVVMIKPTEDVEKVVVGPVGQGDARPQVIIPKGTWFGAIHEEHPVHGYTLVGCTVTPGFDFSDFEMGSRACLLAQFSGSSAQTTDWILKLTKPGV